MPKYPEINVALVGEDGNAFAILGRVNQALRRAGVSKAEQDAFRTEATSGDYNHLLATVMKWVSVDNEDDSDVDYDDDDMDDYCSCGRYMCDRKYSCYPGELDEEV